MTLLSTLLPLLPLFAGSAFAQSDSSSAGSAGASSGAASVTQALPSTTAATAGSIDPNLPQTPQVSSAPYGYTVPALSAITSGAPVDPTVPLDSTFAGGSPATAVSGAPALPTFTTAPSAYPHLDLVPPTNSSEVQGWLASIDFSKVPSYNVTDGTCSGTPGAITDGRCWWTCGGCTRETDITECPDKMTWGLSYDDGPSPYTPLLLDYLDAEQIKTTFFIVGSRAISRPEMLATEYMSGHQLSVHTWSHPYLTTLTNEQIVAELGWTKKIIHDVVGVTPNTFRPPYGDIDDRVRAIAAQMGLTPIIWTSVTVNNSVTNFDTTDWNIPGGIATGESALAKFEQILNTYVPLLDTGFIVLEHDLYQETVDLAVGYVLPMAIASGKFSFKPIIECLGKPLSEAYIETSSNLTSTFITSAPSGTFFQASVGTATGSPITITTGGSTSGASASGASASASKSGAAGVKAELGNYWPAAVAFVAVGLGMLFVA